MFSLVEQCTLMLMFFINDHVRLFERIRYLSSKVLSVVGKYIVLPMKPFNRPSSSYLVWTYEQTNNVSFRQMHVRIKLRKGTSR